MSLAAILVVCFLSAGGPNFGSGPGVRESAIWNQTQEQDKPSSPQPQAPPAQSATPEPGPAPAAKEPQNSPATNSAPAQPSAKRQRQRKKTAANTDCSNAPPAPNAAGESAPNGATNTSSPNDAAAVKPCPPPIVVIKNGGSAEPIVELKGNTSQEQASYQRFTTEQLTTATEANLKQIAGRQLTASQQDMVSQIKQFMEQAKSAIAAGDLARGHNLAVKARLLSDELVKP